MSERAGITYLAKAVTRQAKQERPENGLMSREVREARRARHSNIDTQTIACDEVNS